MSDICIEDLELDSRIVNCCKRHDVFTLNDLAKLEHYDVKHWRGIGKKAIDQMENCLTKHGLSFSF